MTSISSPPCAAPNAPAPPRTAYKWWVVFMLWFVCFFNYADRQAIFAVFPKLEAGVRLRQGAAGPDRLGLHVGLRGRGAAGRLDRRPRARART